MPSPLPPSLRWSMALALALVGAGCGKKDPASCRAVGGHVGKLGAADVKAMPAGQPRRDAELAVGPLAEAVTRTCEETRWDGAVRACMIAATDGAAIAACAQALAPAQRLGAPPPK